MTPEQILYRTPYQVNFNGQAAIDTSALIHAMHEYGKQCFEASRKIGNPQDGSVAFWTYEEYIKSYDYQKQNT